MISKYLTDIGVKESDTPWGWQPDDKKQEFWKTQRDLYGFDERDTWSLDYPIALFIYPRLKMYDEVNIVDTNACKVECGDETLTLQECIDLMLKGFKNFIIHAEEPTLTMEIIKEYEKAIKILSYCIRLLWW